MSNATLTGGSAASLHAVAVPRPPLSSRIKHAGIWLAVLLLLGWSFAPAEMFRAVSLFTDWRNMAVFGAAFLKPNFLHWDTYLSEMLITVQIALWGTALAVVFGIPFAILSASNVCPQWIVQPIRRLMDTFRAINEIVFALLFVVAVGLGPFAGVIAITMHTIAALGKLYSEVIEGIDSGPLEAIRAAGG